MTKAPAPATRLPGPPLRHNRAVQTAIIVLVGTGLAWAGYTALGAIQGQGTPSCSWPLQIHGSANPAQAGFVRCYLRALANRDTGGLMAVAADIPPVRITSADLTYSADARAGLATATFAPNPYDITFCYVTITYADGAQNTLGILNMIAMGGPSGWRMTIGTDLNPASGPPPAAPPASP
jgi:hypothetical protein